MIVSTRQGAGASRPAQQSMPPSCLLRRALSFTVAVVAWTVPALAPAQSFDATRRVQYTYFDANAPAGKRGLLASEIVEPTDNTACVETVHDYDDLGNRISSIVRNCASPAAGAAFAQRKATGTYDAITPVVKVDGSGQAVSVAAGTAATGSVVTVATLADSQTQLLSESREFDPRFGTVTRLTDPNQVTTTWEYDDFGRKVREIRADGTYTATYYCFLTASSSNTDGCPTPLNGEVPALAVMFAHAEPRSASNAKIGPFTRMYMDSLGRIVRTVTESFDADGQPAAIRGSLVARDAVYGQYGTLDVETRSYFLIAGGKGNGSAISWGSDQDYGVRRTLYDHLGRPTTIYEAEPNGSEMAVAFPGHGTRRAGRQQIVYDGLRTTTTNDKGQTRSEEADGWGHIVRATDHHGAQVSHLYNAFGELVRTRDALGNETVVEMDDRGRKKSLTEPNTGFTSYVYDAAGQLVGQTNARGQTTSISYDSMGRVVQRTSPEYTSNWRYDVYRNGNPCKRGLLCETWTSQGINRSVSYDQQSRPVASTTAIDNGPTFKSTVRYDAVTGLVDRQTYPTGLAVEYGYTAGLKYLETVKLAAAATLTPAGGGSVSLPANLALWRLHVASASGAVETQTYHGDISNRNAYESATGRMFAQHTGAGQSGTGVVNRSYTWDSLGRMTDRQDFNGASGNSVGEDFTYDGLNRLTQYRVNSADVPNTPRTVTMTYNALGMLLYKSDVGAYAYPAAGQPRPHALKQLTAATTIDYGYDASGNLTSANGGPFRALSHTSFNLPDHQQGVGGPGGSPRYTWNYDENQQRIKEVRTSGAGTRTTWFMHPDNVGGLGFEREEGPSGVSNRHYLSVGGVAVGVLVSNGALVDPATTTPAITLTKAEFWHKDHQGSLVATTDHAGTVTARYAYDPFGKRRFVGGQVDAFGNIVGDWSTAAGGTDRGYTEHEHLDDVGLIHMNGRLYNAHAGVFLQADPLVADPFNPQSFNRYSYCFGMPLGCTDPSGFSAWTRIRDVGIRVVAAVADIYFCGGYCSAAVGAYQGYRAGGVKGGIVGGVTSYLGYEWNIANADFAAQGFFAAASGCASAAAAGGNCRQGAVGSLQGWGITTLVTQGITAFNTPPLEADYQLAQANVAGNEGVPQAATFSDVGASSPRPGVVYVTGKVTPPPLSAELLNKFWTQGIDRLLQGPSWNDLWTSMNAFSGGSAAAVFGVARVAGRANAAAQSAKAAAAAKGIDTGAGTVLKLKNSLASQAQMAEAGTVMAGPGSRVAFRDAQRVANEHGGNAADWVKKTSSSFADGKGTKFETHWVENLRTGQRVEFKTKFPE